MTGRRIRTAAATLALFIGLEPQAQRSSVSFVAIAEGTSISVQRMTSDAPPRLDLVRKRGTLVCGVTPGVQGFATVDARGR